jgi:predicted RNA-binding protein with TRAM domain
MTRQNVTDGPREILTNRCPVCAGDGIVVSDATHALEVERKLRALAKGSRVQAFQVAVHPRVHVLLAGAGGARLEALEAAARRRFFLVPATGNGHVHLDHVEVVAQGKLESIRPAAPVVEGEEIELKLVEVGLHDPTAGVAKLDGDYEVVVAGASKLVGKKVKATVGRALEGVAYAVLTGAEAAGASPITFEAEADKPTRASRSKKEPEPAAAEDVAEPVEAASSEDAVDAAGDEMQLADGQPKKKRTRRGTRGGRGRKKPAPAATSDDADTGASDDAANGRPTPRIHVPPADLEAADDTDAAAPEATVDAVAEGDSAPEAAVAADGPPKPKRSRRGSRGGRKRRKPTPTGADEAATEADPVPVESPAGDGVPEYVPMSEWIEDFDAARRA